MPLLTASIIPSKISKVNLSELKRREHFEKPGVKRKGKEAASKRKSARASRSRRYQFCCR